MLTYVDHSSDPASWARNLGVSPEAVELHLKSDVIDLHVDSFIWSRVWGYDLTKRHGHGAFGARFYSQVDFPRIREAGVTGATWSITTNPFAPTAKRSRIFLENLQRLRQIIASAGEDFEVVRNAGEYRRARAAGKHGAFIGIQGGNALEGDLGVLDQIPDSAILRITLVHLSTSRLGVTSAPTRRGGNSGLTDLGREYVRRLNANKIFVDLAHIHRQGFFDAVEVHDKSQPLIVTHTGVNGVHRHWRNLDDDQLRAVADTGGTIGIIYQSQFLGDPFWGGKLSSVVDHLEHIVRTVGEDHASLGSDWDGAICPPRDMPTCLELPRLVELMLRRGWSSDRIAKILGGNFLRVLTALRG